MTEHTDIVIIGAGLAGLCATRELADRGHSVILVEARNRVGGRTFSAPLSSAQMIVDLGAEWIAPEHHLAMVSELARYHIRLEPPESGMQQAGDREGVAVEEKRAALIHLLNTESKKLIVSRADWYRASSALDKTVSTWLEELDLDLETKEWFLANSFALQGASAERYSFLNLLHEFAAFGGVESAFSAAEYRIEGGAQSLANAIAESLKPHIRMDWPVERVAQERNSMLVQGPMGSLSTRLVIVAAPVNVLGDWIWDVPLPGKVIKIINQGHVGRAAKGWATGAASSAIESTGWPDAIEVYSRATGAAQAVCTFGVAEPNHTEALSRSWQAVSARHPEMMLSNDLLSHDWISDPYSRGTWLSCAPGQFDGLHAMANMPPPCLFAGGDVSQGWYGWMEGAVTSGIDAALRCHRYIASGMVAPAAG